jgi:hypothetical protein
MPITPFPSKYGEHTSTGMSPGVSIVDVFALEAMISQTSLLRKPITD